MDDQIQVVTVPVADVDQAEFADPDGNTWVLQEIGYRGPSSAGR